VDLPTGQRWVLVFILLVAVLMEESGLEPDGNTSKRLSTLREARVTPTCIRKARRCRCALGKALKELARGVGSDSTFHLPTVA